MSYPKAEGEPEGETEPEYEAEPEAESEVSASESEPEPEPEWSTAFKTWGDAWHTHVYLFATLFLIVALLTAMSMRFYLTDRRRLKQGKLTFTLQCLLFFFTSIRSLCLFVNPYQTKTMDYLTFDILWSLALPGLTASFSVLLLVFLDTTKMTLGPPVFQRLSVLLIFTACHFVIVMSADIVCYVGNACRPMLMFCQTLFMLYGTVLFAGYLYIAVELYKKCTSGGTVVNAEDNKKVTRLIRISTAAALISLSVIVTYTYLAASDFGIYSDTVYVDAWDWWIVQSILRIEELSSACLILVIAFRKPYEEDSKLGIWFANKCKGKQQNSITSARDISSSLTKTNKVAPVGDTTVVVCIASPSIRHG